MHKIPEDLDLNIIKGKTVNQVVFGLNAISILFSPKLFIQWSGGFSISILGKKNEFESVFPVQNDFGLLKLLEKEVVSVSISQNRDMLSITFNDNINLELISDIYYESFTVYINDKEIII